MSVVISDAWRQRFGGTARLYGEKALQLFADAHICVVGIGGVGSWAAEALARTGIGAITLIDMDDVCVTNTNRQIHALRDNVGLAKAEVMAERIRQINPECRVTVVDDFVTPDNVAQYMSVGYSYVIDAIDSVRPKAALIAYCRRNKIPLVTTGGAGGQIAHRDVEEVAVEFRVQNAVTAYLGAGAAEKKLPVLHFHGHVSGDVHEGLGPAQIQGLTFGFLHGLGEEQGAVRVDDGGHAVEGFQNVEKSLMLCAVGIVLARGLVLKNFFLSGKSAATAHGKLL